jgi:hypothetical protein
MKINVEETLKAADITDWTPILVYSEVLEGARRPLAFLEVVKEDFSLIGKDGSTLHVPKATQLTAGEDTETNVASGISASDKTISSVSISPTNIIYSAVELTDYLLEDFVSLDLVRLHLRNMGSAVMEKLDSNIKDVLAAGYGVLYTEDTAMDYTTVSTALANMEENGWMVDPNTPPFLIVNPMAAATMAQDTKFTETPRFYASDPSRLLGEAGMYSECRVLKTSLLANTGNAYIVYPPNYKFGPSVILAWKRRIRVNTERYENKEITYYITTIRAKSGVVQAHGVCRINITTTP